MEIAAEICLAEERLLRSAHLLAGSEILLGIANGDSLEHIEEKVARIADETRDLIPYYYSPPHTEHIPQLGYFPKRVKKVKKKVVRRYVRVKKISKPQKVDYTLTRKRLVRDALAGVYNFRTLEEKLRETNLTDLGINLWLNNYKNHILNHAKQNHYSSWKFRKYVKSLGFKNVREFTKPYSIQTL